MGPNPSIRDLMSINTPKIASSPTVRGSKAPIYPTCHMYGILARDLYLSVYNVFSCNWCIYSATGERQHLPWPSYSATQKECVTFDGHCSLVIRYARRDSNSRGVYTAWVKSICPLTQPFDKYCSLAVSPAMTPRSVAKGESHTHVPSYLCFVPFCTLKENNKR